MATPKSQRIGIWIIAVVMLVGTLGSFAVLVLANQNAATEQEEQKKLLEDFQKEQDKLAQESAAKSQQLSGYTASKFDGDSVNELKKTVIVEGKGKKVEKEDTINVSYFGWLPSGKIFDSSKKEGKDTPIDFALNQVIPGWTEGLAGEKVGSTIKLVIPADKAYGEQASGVIPENSPLTFIIKINKIVEETE